MQVPFTPRPGDGRLVGSAPDAKRAARSRSVSATEEGPHLSVRAFPETSGSLEPEADLLLLADRVDDTPGLNTKGVSVHIPRESVNRVVVIVRHVLAALGMRGCGRDAGRQIHVDCSQTQVLLQRPGLVGAHLERHSLADAHDLVGGHCTEVDGAVIHGEREERGRLDGHRDGLARVGRRGVRHDAEHHTNNDQCDYYGPLHCSVLPRFLYCTSCRYFLARLPRRAGALACMKRYRGHRTGSPRARAVRAHSVIEGTKGRAWSG